MLILRQSTAVTIQMGPAVDATDGVTPETGLTPTVHVTKNGAAQAARSSGTAIAHDRDGYYRVHLDATDTGTLGMLVAQFTDAATHLPVVRAAWVVHQDIYDLLFSGNGFLQDLLEAADTVETGLSVRGALQLAAAMVGGVHEGMEDGDPVSIRAAKQGAAGTVRSTFDADEHGNRSSMTVTTD